MIHNNYESDQDSPLEISGKSTREIKTKQDSKMQIKVPLSNKEKFTIGFTKSLLFR